MAIRIDNLSRSSAGLSRPIVEAVSKGSPAQAAGLQAGDEIVSINGQSVRGDLIPELIWNSKGQMKLTVKRDGKVIALKSVIPQKDGAVNNLGFELVGAGNAPSIGRASGPLQTKLGRFLAGGGTVSGVRA